MNRLENTLLNLIKDDNQEKKNFPEEHTEEDAIFWEVEVWTSENLVENKNLSKYWSENEIYSALKRLENNGFIFSGYKDRLFITNRGILEIYPLWKKVCNNILNQWIAIIALIISILTFLLK